MLMTKTILSNMLHKYATRLHPMEQRSPASGNRGGLAIAAEKCTSCRLCAMKCPTKVITVDAEAGVWEQRIMGCVYCGVCAEVCPTQCITMLDDYRRPFMETAFLRCNVKARPKKVKPAEAPAVEGAKAVEEKPAKADAAGEAKPLAAAQDKAAKDTKAAVVSKRAVVSAKAAPAKKHK